MFERAILQEEYNKLIGKINFDYHYYIYIFFMIFKKCSNTHEFNRELDETYKKDVFVSWKRRGVSNNRISK